MGWLCSLPWALGWLWGFGASTGTAGIAGIAGIAGGVPLHQLALSTQRLAPGEAQAVLSMVRGCEVEVEVEVEVEAAAGRLRAAGVIHTLKVVHRLDAEPLSKKSPWIKKT
ncbi:hypothetical protein HMPREF3042_06100 [Corynebacterium sp. HMSC074C05]|nr:hypothetical protein HMPREF3042_06100 [Corynebacterium sp. HMSC074C05]